MDGILNLPIAGVQNVPAVNVVENADGFRIKVAAPGLSKEDFKLNLNHNNLMVLACKETKLGEKEGENLTRREFNYSSFQRTFMLPAWVDSESIQTHYTDGVLKISIPKREEAKVEPTRQIEIG